MTDTDRQNAATLARIERSLESPPERRIPSGAVVLHRTPCGETCGHEPDGTVCGREPGHDGDCGCWVPGATEEIEVIASPEEVDGDAYPLAGGQRIGPAYPWSLDDDDQDEVILAAEERERDEYERAAEDAAEARAERMWDR